MPAKAYFALLYPPRRRFSPSGKAETAAAMSAIFNVTAPPPPPHTHTQAFAADEMLSAALRFARCRRCYTMRRISTCFRRLMLLLPEPAELHDMI